MTSTTIANLPVVASVNLIVREINNKFVVFNGTDVVCATMHATYVPYNYRRGRHAFIAKMTNGFTLPMNVLTISKNEVNVDFAQHGVRKQKTRVLKGTVSIEAIAPVEEIVETVAEKIADVLPDVVVIACPECGSVHHKKNGKNKKTGLQAYRCKECNKNF